LVRLLVQTDIHTIFRAIDGVVCYRYCSEYYTAHTVRVCTLSLNYNNQIFVFVFTIDEVVLYALESCGRPSPRLHWATPFFFFIKYILFYNTRETTLFDTYAVPVYLMTQTQRLYIYIYYTTIHTPPHRGENDKKKIKLFFIYFCAPFI